jgi:serine/threonine protein phosphatase PrpC
VCAEPEIITRDLGPSDAFLVLASDGVFEFLSSQQVVDLVSHAVVRDAVTKAAMHTCWPPAHHSATHALLKYNSC